MKDRTKDIIVTFGFVSILIMVFILNIIIKDNSISVSERRKLETFPEINLKTIFNSSTMDNLDKYAADQFMIRDDFRKLKAFAEMNIFLKKDNNKMFEKDGAIYKMEYPLNEQNLLKSIQKINNIYNKHLKEMNVYYCIIPDKNYYLENDDHLKIDYSKLKNIAMDNLKDMKYIDIFSELELQDYYSSDIHWKQEKLGKVVNKIKKEMKLENNDTKYDIIDKGNFYGVYYGKLATKAHKDKLNILTNSEIENCITYNVETGKYGKVYDESKTLDKYDIFVSGATPIITITNPDSDKNKELILFRDSFGSSIAPLLIDSYSKITLVDIRYISPTLLDKYITFENQDVLFLYSSLILNQNIFK